MRSDSKRRLLAEGLEPRMMLAADMLALAETTAALPNVDDGIPAFIAGDANRDGEVNQLDLAIWESQFGTVSNLAATAPIPEPATLSLAPHPRRAV